MSGITLNPNLQDLGGLLTKNYPRRGILLFKLLEDIRTGFSSLSIETRDSILCYSAMLNRRCSPIKVLNTLPHSDALPSQSTEVGIDKDLVDQKLKAMLNFLNKLTVCPAQITQDDIQSLYEKGWSEREFLDSIYLCAIANCMNTFINGLKFASKNELHKNTHV